MKIEVKVATILLSKADPPLPSARFDFEMRDGGVVDDLISELGLPPELVGSVTVNNRRSGRDRRLNEGDLVALVPAISGG